MAIHVQSATVTLPYPGLRPFRRDEFEIFFGREEHVAKLAERLQKHHFVAVVGPSGCGKSSLVTAGLMPYLAEGYGIDIEGPWYEATIRPGDRPISRLAKELVSSGVLSDQSNEDRESRIGFLDASLRRGPLGVIEALDGAKSLDEGNLLILVDQFEEIFRFRSEKNDQEADAFVELLLETVRQAEENKLRIYVMLTMRSDYLGDCNQFSGLPEEISDSQFLTPRLDREQRHAAIVGPAAMFGGEVEPPLVNRLLNDMGDDSDQLPIMQHALMRMWSLKTVSETKRFRGDVATAEDLGDQEIVLTTDIYEDVGGWANTLSNHADEAFKPFADDPGVQRVTEMMFRSLTQRGTDQNDVRRPVRVSEVAEVAGVDTDVVRKVADAFRRSDRSFVTPGMGHGENGKKELADDDILDISHESLIRQWGRLKTWAKEEGDSAAISRRLAGAAERWKAGKEAHLQSPGLDIALQWREDEKPNAAWVRRYGTNFELAMKYLDESRNEKVRRQKQSDTQRDELATQHARADEQAQTAARFRRFLYGITCALVFSIGVTVWAFAERGKAETARNQSLLDRDAAQAASNRAMDSEASAKIKQKTAEDALADARRLMKERDETADELYLQQVAAAFLKTRQERTAREQMEQVEAEKQKYEDATRKAKAAKIEALAAKQRLDAEAALRNSDAKIDSN